MPEAEGSEVVLAAHLPLVQIGEDSIPFAGGDLWRMPFEIFNKLTAGAFDDHRAEFEGNAPVFYRLVVRPQMPNLRPLDASRDEAINHQLKLSRASWSLLDQVGLGVIGRFHDFAVNPAWLALLLMAPRSVLPAPRWSMTFAVADEGFGFAIGERVGRIASVQGDADVDYLITPGFATTTFDGETITAASAWAERIADGSSLDPRLASAVEALGECASPLLTASDRTVLATVALESLLLPEIRGGMASVLARRTAALLDGASRRRRELESVTRGLYAARGASLHGEEPGRSATEVIDAMLGPQMLAAAVRALHARTAVGGRSVTDYVARLETPASEVAPAESAAPAILDEGPAPVSLAFLRRRLSTVAIGASQLRSSPGSWLMWAPLAGLRCRQPLKLDDSGHRLVIPLSGHEVLQLEERDIARDFVAPLRMVEEHIAALCLVVAAEQASEAEQALRCLQRERDLAVAALRMSGFTDFCDPALAGAVMMEQTIRLRRPSVLRQSVLRLMLDDDDAIDLGPEAGAGIARRRQLLSDYESCGGHLDIERALSLYLRGFDRRFTALPTCAALHFALIESLLGRFRPDEGAAPLETLVARLLGNEAPQARWFAVHGRRVRNDVAHGRTADAVDRETLDALATIGGAAIERALGAWLTRDDARTSPATILQDELSSVDAR